MVSVTGVAGWLRANPRMLRHLADPRRFPALTAFLASGAFDVADDPDDEFTFGLDRILDGVGALVRAPGYSKRKPPGPP